MLERKSTYSIGNVPAGFQSEVERLKAQAVMGWDKEFRNLKWYGLHNGMRVLEVGSGPGFITEQLVNSLPDSQITALEYDKSLLDEAERRIAAPPSSRLELVHGSVYETGLADNTYDFVIARLLFLHLHNPSDAAKEIYRVLKPGGKLVIIDIDDGIFGAVNPDSAVLPSVIRKLAAHQAAKGGNRYVGRTLPRLLTESGYCDVDMDAVVQHSDLHGIEGFRQQFNINRYTPFYKKGMISAEEYGQISRVSEALNSSPEAYAMMTFLMACGRKPDYKQ
ncbi:Demethylmenaquinone methyltransferase [compost metagenome]